MGYLLVNCYLILFSAFGNAIYELINIDILLSVNGLLLVLIEAL